MNVQTCYVIGGCFFVNNNTSSWSLVVGLFLAVFMSSYSAAQVQSSASLPNRQELTKSKRLKIVATVKKGVSKDSLILDWSVRNVSRKDVSFRDTYVLRDYSFVVKDQKGAIVEPTKEGRQKIFESSFVSHRSPVNLHHG